jgi:hypothetical protein
MRVDDVVEFLKPPSAQTVHSWNKKGVGPPYFWAGYRIRYQRREVLKWFVERTEPYARCGSDCGPGVPSAGLQKSDGLVARRCATDAHRPTDDHGRIKAAFRELGLSEAATKAATADLEEPRYRSADGALPAQPGAMTKLENVCIRGLVDSDRQCGRGRMARSALQRAFAIETSTG